jgi:hypothetical protein
MPRYIAESFASELLIRGGTEGPEPPIGALDDASSSPSAGG